MSRRVKAIIRYDGPALADHEMDINDLAPSLLALGEICREANRILNGDAASVRVLVRADIEQQCFQLGLELVQTWFEQMTALLDQDGVHNAKNILEWIGIIKMGTGAAIGTLWCLLKFIAKHQKSGITYNIDAKSGSVVYISGDDSTISVPMPVHRLAQSPEILKSTQN